MSDRAGDVSDADVRVGAGMSRGLTFLFALAGAVAVGNLYWSQPLLAVIAEDLGVSAGTAGFLVTGTQIGYAVGVLFIVPLGDVMNRRILIPIAMVASAVALAAAAAAPSFAMLLLSLVAVGLLTTGGQMIPPLASDLATPAQRGDVVGTIASGMLGGILLSRAVSGLLADAFGWHVVFAIAAISTLAMATLLWRLVPADADRVTVPYGELIASIFRTVRRHPVARATLALGACIFAVFTLFWTGLTFLLTADPFDFSLSQIGLTGLAGLVGAMAAKNAGLLHDRGLSVPAQGVALVVTLGCLGASAFAATSILMVVVVIAVFDAAIQTVNILNQVRLLNVDPEARSRLNSAFVTSNFIGGAIGLALAGVLWAHVGWTGLMATSGVLILLALTIWVRWRPAFAAAMGEDG